MAAERGTRPATPPTPPTDELATVRDELDRTRQELRQALDLLRTAQAQVVQAGRLSALGQLMAGVAHEMNNPLTSVIGYAQMVHQQVAQRPALAEQAPDLLPDLGHILAEASRATRIVRNLLMFARRQNVTRNYQALEFLCDQVVELRAHDLKVNGIEVKASYSSNLPAVFADGSQIQQVLLNLILNAEQAVRQSRIRRIDVNVTPEPSCDAVLMEVRDSGEGIPKGALERVFDPFFTTRPPGEGTGLGLSIAHTIVRDHGGRIWVESEPDVRTSFFVRLPASEDQATPGSRGAVVVLHEDPGVRGPIAAAFTGWGFEARAAGALGDILSNHAIDPVLLLAHASVARVDPRLWEVALMRWGDRSRLVVISDAASDSVEEGLRRGARAIVSPAADLCELKTALDTVLGS
jgi:signal transduction histidine kinase